MKADYISVCDVSLNESFTGLDIAGDLSLDIGGDLTQTIAPIQVDGLTTLTATGTICLVGGDCDGVAGTDNDFNTLIITNATNAEIFDANDLTVNGATVANQLWLVSGDADTTPGDGNDGLLTLAGGCHSGKPGGRNRSHPFASQ